MLVNTHALPRLNTDFVEPLHYLERHFIAKHAEIEAWFLEQWKSALPPVYGSVDLRNAGFKVAPIDMNLFPAGFNNLNPDFLSRSVEAAREIIHHNIADTKNILLIPEAHTRNMAYWNNIQILLTILDKAGFWVKLGSFSDDLHAPLEILLEDGNKILIEPIVRQHDKVVVANFMPDLILLNNDLSDGIPAILKQISQPIVPPAELGWSQRFKSEHFQYYAQVAAQFAEAFSFDAWMIAPMFRYCGELNFMQQEGMDCLIENAEIMFAELKKKYQEYRISREPFLIVKADAGTYGMAVMTVRHVDELRKLNRKQRTRMSMTKGGQPVNRVIIQEGVYTFEAVGPENAVAEPVVYLWGSHVVGGFYRVHKNRGVDENLNTPGMHFEPIAFSKTCDEPCINSAPDASQNRFYVYGTIARLSMLAAGYEIKDHVGLIK